MATRAEQARYLAERSGPKHPKSPRPHARNAPRPRNDRGATSEVDTARRNLHSSRAALSRATYTLESSSEKPSRKSTRKSANRAKPDSNLERRRIRRVGSPERRAERGASAKR